MKKRKILVKKMIVLAPLAHAAANNPQFRAAVKNGIRMGSKKLREIDRLAANPSVGTVSGKIHPTPLEAKLDSLADKAPTGTYSKLADKVDLTVETISKGSKAMKEKARAHCNCGESCGCNTCDCQKKSSSTDNNEFKKAEWIN